MAKELYACIECGYETSKWLGRCTSCGSWDSLKKVEQKDLNFENVQKAKILKFSATSRKGSNERIKTGFSELDRVLGGGFVSGEVLLIGGEPGIGKTSLLLQILDKLNSKYKNVAYISAEESIDQLKVHAKRLGVNKSFDVICENNIDSVVAALLGKNYKVVVLDSIQTVRTNDLKGLPGGVGQVRECASRMVNYAKKSNTIVILVGHITKGGDLAGPKLVEHIVDAVFYFEGNSQSDVRILRGVKNRFGSIREIGVFNYDGRCFKDVSNPSELFITSDKERKGVCKGVIFEGARAILVELQALIVKSSFNMPQRVTSGLRKSKIQMICALLTKYTKANLSERDVYLNVAGGLKVDDFSLDLSACIALLSSYYDKEISPKKVAIGEVSLTGQVISTGNIAEKVKAVKRLGYNEIIVPQGTVKLDKGISEVDSISQLQRFLT